MENNGPLDALPLWALFVVILLVVLLSVEFGYRLGKYRRSRREEEKEAPLGTMVGATLGLLAFILAFTFGLAAARFDSRRLVLLDEANAIGTTYLRAGMLPERGEQIRGFLRDYVAARLEGVQPGKLAEGIRRSEDIQEKVWTEAETVGQKNPNSIVVGLFVQSLNEMIDLHAKRLQAGVRSRIPAAIWLGLFAVASLSCHDGLSRRLEWNSQVSRDPRGCRHVFCGHRAHRRFGSTVRRSSENQPTSSSRRATVNESTNPVSSEPLATSRQNKYRGRAQCERDSHRDARFSACQQRH
jgi:hypothetical protein